MGTASPNLPALLEQAGFKPRKGASRSDLAETEEILGFKLPAEFAQLWLYSDGLEGDGIEILSLSQVQDYAGAFDGGFDYFPFTDCNDSNPYAICCRAPLRGMIAHVMHDDASELVCTGLPRFLELLMKAQKNGDVSDIHGDFAFDVPQRNPEAESVASKLLDVAKKMEPDDFWKGVALQFAAQLYGVGREDDLARLLDVGDEYTRDAVCQRWQGLNTVRAKQLLREDEAAFQSFLVELKQAFEAAGFRTNADRSGRFMLEPGHIGLNFAMIFARCSQPGAMAKCVQKFVDRDLPKSK